MVGQNGSVKIRVICHVGGLLLCVFVRCCVCWSMIFFFKYIVIRTGAIRSSILLQPIIYIRSFVCYISEVWVVMRKIRFVVSTFSVYKRVVLRVLIF